MGLADVMMRPGLRVLLAFTMMTVRLIPTKLLASSDISSVEGQILKYE
jgi:hypothetical protein